MRQIDREIPYHILFLLEYEGKYQAWITYKAADSGTNTFKVGSYYHTDWMEEAALPLKLDGLTTDQIYENFVRQIAGEALTSNADETLKESVERDKRRKELQKQIVALQVKVRRERQFNKQVELSGQLKMLKRELEELS